MLKRSLLVVSMAAVVLAGCRNKQAAEEAAPAAESTAVPVPAAPAEAAPVPAPAEAKAFDVNTIAVSDKPLGQWPYLVLPAGYAFEHADKLREQTKDLARVPVWTGSGYTWVEGKVFVDGIDASEGKTWSQFELRKGIQSTLEALGAVKIGEVAATEEAIAAEDAALTAFKDEFGAMYHTAVGGPQGADAYALRTADRLLWFVPLVRKDDGALMVVEAPLPSPPAP